MLLPAGPLNIWHAEGEVRGVAVVGQNLYAATESAVAVCREGTWRWLPHPPAAPRSLVPVRDEVRIATNQGGFAWRGERWMRESIPTPARRPVAVPPESGATRFACGIDYQGQRLASFWGSNHLWRVGAVGWEPFLRRAPGKGDNGLAASGDSLWAATTSGLYRWNGARWRREPLPVEVPSRQPRGMYAGYRDYLVGGADGLWRGRLGAWRQIDRRAVRQILPATPSPWVLFEDGGARMLTRADGADSLKKVTCLARDGRTLLAGSLGGWYEQGRQTIARFPKELLGQTVTAVAGQGGARWIGTKSRDLYRFGRGAPKRFLFRDPHVTALLPTREGVYVATATSGLYHVTGDRAKPVTAPSTRIRHLAFYHGRLVLAGEDGAWMKGRRGWRALATDGLPVKNLTVGSRLVLITGNAIRFVR